MQFQKIHILVQGPHNFADVSIFLQKVYIFLAKRIPLLKAIV